MVEKDAEAVLILLVEVFVDFVGELLEERSFQNWVGADHNDQYFKIY